MIRSQVASPKLINRSIRDKDRQSPCSYPVDLHTAPEQGDYNLKYLVAAALLDDQLGPAQLEEARIQAPDAQALLKRVDIRPDERFSTRYPHELSARVTIRTRDQHVFVKEQNGYEGGLTNPMSWERTVEKFLWLTEAFADEELRSRLIGTVERLDTSELSDLTDLLALVRPAAVFPTTHPGIQ
jgi:2-methylcitrate dehydratase